MSKATYLGQKSIHILYGCKRPCVYYEYKVEFETTHGFKTAE